MKPLQLSTQQAFTCSKLIIKRSERGHWHGSGIFIVNFEHILDIILVFPFLTLTN